MAATRFYVLLLTIVESVLAFYSFPHIFPRENLSGAFLIFSAINGLMYGIWSCFIYPFFFSPLRHLPTPRTVRTTFATLEVLLS